MRLVLSKKWMHMWSCKHGKKYLNDSEACKVGFVKAPKKNNGKRVSCLSQLTCASIVHNVKELKYCHPKNAMINNCKNYECKSLSSAMSLTMLNNFGKHCVPLQSRIMWGAWSNRDVWTSLPSQNGFLNRISAFSAVCNKNMFSTTSSSLNRKLMNPQSQISAERISNAPKNVLHNLYDVVAREFNNTELKARPVFNVIKGKNTSQWCCTYHLTWPESMKFVSTAFTKKEASHKAAASALLWLKKCEKITNDGQPVLLNELEVKEMRKHTIPSLSLDANTLSCLTSISEIYENKFIPLITEKMDGDVDKSFENGYSSDSEINASNFNVRKRVFSKEAYFSKEKCVLPISSYKEQFLHLLKDNNIIIIRGEPGCGKSTRIPQYVLESWAKEGYSKGEPCQIAVTQPRRIAASSLANRVADERDENCGQIVGYQVRLKSNFNPSTGRILYCTTGILLKYLQSDINLSSFTHIILDEAHERDLNTDLLINLLKKAVTVNPNLKLIVMSATVDIELFKNYLNSPPILEIPGFTYPVNSHFLDDLKELQLGKTASISENSNQIPNIIPEDVVRLIQHVHSTKREGAILVFLPGWEDISKVQKLLPPTNDMMVLCLHSRLQDTEQRKIFHKPPPGVRKVILSTNIAETSITIDDVVYVVDCGIHKENHFNNEIGVTCLDNVWVSKSSMTQRKGRAGRVQPGESFHLYTKERYDSLSEHTKPEILKTSLTKTVLNCKVYSNNMDALQFMSQLPTPPEEGAIKRAVLELKDLKLLKDNEDLTSLGRKLANFQMEPRLAKILVNSLVFKCVTPIVDIVTIFSAETALFASSLLDKENIRKIKSQCSKTSDHLAMMRLFEAWLELMEDEGEMTAQRYCQDANLIHYKLITIEKLRKIHFDYLHDNLRTFPAGDSYSDNDELVKAVLYSGAGNILRHRNWDVVKGRLKKSNVLITSQNHKAAITSESVNFRKSSFPSNLMIYFNEVRSTIRKITLIRECSLISPIAILLFSNKNLTIKEGESEDKVIVGLENTGVEFIVSKQEAQQLKECKEALYSMYEFLIFLMSENRKCDRHIDDLWRSVLDNLNTLFQNHAIK